jgi:transketolase
MRTGFIEALTELAAADDRVFLLTADLGWSVVESFAARFPDRFLNVGVAEQNMLGVATGLAMVGYVPFVYSIATFSSMRCYEQIRNGPVLHRLPVRVVGIGGGYAYGHAGPTHHALEDLCLARAQPGLTVLAPADRLQAKAVVHATSMLDGPAYLRIGKAACGELPGLNGRFAFDRPEVVHPGSDLLFLCTGDIAFEALEAAAILEQQGVSAAVAVLAHLSFSHAEPLLDLLRPYRTVVSVEEGYTSGGLGALIAQTIAAENVACRLLTCGVTASFPEFSGSTAFMRRHCGLTAVQLAEVAGRHSERRSRAA